MDHIDPVSLARLQFAMTALYHFLFVPLTLGRAGHRQADRRQFRKSLLREQNQCGISPGFSALVLLAVAAFSMPSGTSINCRIKASLNERSLAYTRQPKEFRGAEMDATHLQHPAVSD